MFGKKCSKGNPMELRPADSLPKNDIAFRLFIASVNPRASYYKSSHGPISVVTISAYLGQRHTIPTILNNPKMSFTEEIIGLTY